MSNVHHPCPICGNEITIEKERQDGGMDGGYYDWKIFCNNCHLINVYYSADCFYGRDYYETPSSALAAFDNYIMKFNKICKGCSKEDEEAGYVKVVRCKDCKYYKDGFCYNPNTYDDEKIRGNTSPDWYCADGRKAEKCK